jgi:uncharacterized protein YjgD (DUF1641 family)
MAETVGKYILEEGLANCIEYSEKSGSFKLKLSLANLPEVISKAIKFCTKETTTGFAGKKVKVRMMSASLLTDQLLSDLKALTETHNFTDWVNKMLDEKEEKQEKFGAEFYKQVQR